jgi:hypothetical protein
MEGQEGIGQQLPQTRRSQQPLPTRISSAITMKTALPSPTGLRKPSLIGSRTLGGLVPHRKFPGAGF